MVMFDRAQQRNHTEASLHRQDGIRRYIHWFVLHHLKITKVSHNNLDFNCKTIQEC